jgi:hypothetical protein
MTATASQSTVDLVRAPNLISSPPSESSAQVTTWRGRLAIGIVVASLMVTVLWAAFLVTIAGFIIGSLL